MSGDSKTTEDLAREHWERCHEEQLHHNATSEHAAKAADRDLAEWRKRWDRQEPEPAPEPEYAKHQPCGCVLCTCEDKERCHGCGAKCCAEHRSGAPRNYVKEPARDPSPQPETVESVLDAIDRSVQISQSSGTYRWCATCREHGAYGPTVLDALRSLREKVRGAK